MEQAAEQIVEIVTHLDDASGEVVGHATAALLAEGSLDVWTTPVSMKKNRPGVMLSLLCLEADSARLARRVMELTGSFGVRYRAWDRLVLHRRHETVETPYGPVRVKIGELDGKIIARKPEFQDVLKAAAAHGVSPRQVLGSL